MLILRPHFAPVIERERDPQNGIMAKRLGKRKIDSECRVFNPQWTHDYFLFNAKKKLFQAVSRDDGGIQRIQSAPTL